MNQWKEILKSSNKTCLTQDGKRKIHYTFDDGSEMVEEYKLTTNDILIRKHKLKTIMGAESKWEYEIGLDPTPKLLQGDDVLIENINNPMITRSDSLDCFEWRIRNLEYPLDVYNINVVDNWIIVKTTNKKYYKKLIIPDMNRLNLKLDSAKLNFAHANNTLIIKYTKPREILEMESEIRKELKKMSKHKEGDLEMCTPS